MYVLPAHLQLLRVPACNTALLNNNEHGVGGSGCSFFNLLSSHSPLFDPSYKPFPCTVLTTVPPPHHPLVSTCLHGDHWTPRIAAPCNALMSLPVHHLHIYFFICVTSYFLLGCPRLGPAI